MKQATYVPVSNASAGSGPTTSHTRKSAADNLVGSIQTFTPAANTSAVLITVETTAARVTLDGTDPSVASAPSLVFPISLAPVLIPVGPGTTFKHVSTAGTASVVQYLELS